MEVFWRFGAISEGILETTWAAPESSQPVMAHDAGKT